MAGILDSLKNLFGRGSSESAAEAPHTHEQDDAHDHDHEHDHEHEDDHEH